METVKCQQNGVRVQQGMWWMRTLWGMVSGYLLGETAQFFTVYLLENMHGGDKTMPSIEICDLLAFIALLFYCHFKCCYFNISLVTLTAAI